MKLITHDDGRTQITLVNSGDLNTEFFMFICILETLKDLVVEILLN